MPEEYMQTKEEEYYDSWLSDNIYDLREEFVKSDPTFRENYPYYEDTDTERAEYIELMGLDDEFNTYCKQAFKED